MQASKSQAKPKPRANLPKPAAPQLVVRSIALTPAADEMLTRLMEAGKERAGRKISASAVVRALLEFCERKGVEEKIYSAIEAELNAGTVVWGGRPPA